MLRILFLVLMFMPWQAFASCTETPSGVVKTINSPASITINPYQAVGSVLYTGTFTGNSGNLTVTCTTNFTTLTYQGIGTPTSNIYPTSITGIGYTIQNTTGTTGLWPVSITQASSNTITGTANAAVEIQLIKTGAIPSDGTLAINVGNFVLPQEGNFVIFPINLNSPLVVNFSKPSCTVSTTSIAIALGTYPTSYFNTNTSTTPVPFNIQVVCQQGPNGSTTAISATFTDASGSSTSSTNTTQTLTLSPSSTASGIGVQVQYSGTAVTYNPTPPATSASTGLIALGTEPNGTYNFPFTATMVKTGTVTAGSVIATATFTISYQ